MSGPTHANAKLSNGALTVTGANGVGASQLVKSTGAKHVGKFYLEFTINYLRSTSGGLDLGVCNANQPVTDYTTPGQTTSNGFSIRVGGTGAVGGYANSTALNSGNPYVTGAVAGDVIQIAVDCTTGKVWAGRNGTWFASGNPAAP